MNSDERGVERTDPPPIDLPSELHTDVVVLPREVDDGKGLYDASVITIVKEFRSAGVSAEYQHDPDSRAWIGEQGVLAITFDLLVGIGSNAAWAALCLLLRSSHGSERVRVRVGRFRKTKTETTWEWYKVEGPGAAVAAALEAIEAPEASEPDEEEATEGKSAKA